MQQVQWRLVACWSSENPCLLTLTRLPALGMHDPLSPEGPSHEPLHYNLNLLPSFSSSLCALLQRIFLVLSHVSVPHRLISQIQGLHSRMRTRSRYEMN